MSADAATFLFSIDLEDIRSLLPDGARYAERVPTNIDRYLAFFARHETCCTFFTVGDVARRYPDLVARILAAGHEIACHSSDHEPLDHHDRESFRDDLRRNLDDLRHAGATDIRGFRAPVLSLGREQPWAYDVLAELGFQYSSSVLAARNPLYGWPGFGFECRRMPSGIWEIPPSLSEFPLLCVPYTGGVYFRVLPFCLIRRSFRHSIAQGRPVVGYAHPYDIDTELERFMQPGLDVNRLYNRLMYLNRNRVFPRLEALLAEKTTIVPYAAFVETRLVERSGAGADT